MLKSIQIKNQKHQSLEITEIFSFNSEETYKKINNILDNLKDIFESYAIIGDKFDYYNLSISGYIKFLTDCELIFENQSAQIKNELSRINSLAYMDLSNNYSPKASERQSRIEDYLLRAKSSLSRKIENIPKGKLNKNDIYIIFNYICGSRNFDKSEKIKTYFDKNPGSIKDIKNCHFVPDLSEKSILKSSREVQVSKMNFTLFLKSFELLAKKIYWQASIEEAIGKFIDIDIAPLINNKSKNKTLKKSIIEKLLSLRADEIVTLLLINLFY